MTDDRVVLVTGGARNIGAAIAARFASDGASVVVADREHPVHADARIRYELTDVSDATAVETLFGRVADDYGRVDVLVNNVGIWYRRPFQEITVEEWDQVLNVNLRSVFLCVRAALPLMEAAGGAIVNMGSQAGVTVTRGQGAHYAASKAAISHLTKVLAVEFGPLGIRINCVAPGVTLPEPAVLPPQALAQIPLGRAGGPDDLTGACVFLASSEAAYITGQTLLVNGGAVALL
ncbi:SDR family oxidoreductase [Mycobacterium sp. CVI_P3]|uniref:SDR family oxidoreductase n=1 Tax=Mycobacterium pinniadriaticum TaxID=2994102 RepID=A0ABT3SKV7_9MYCO|nr:SDR family oxidoreductase [Mycobacterium pinniadriaticum]MCX2933737.1 SDR family oxidoreductase [Mycobacterium pinniadriaticum]MCX2940159.1 SDR family oxidoreductase [Mycobacterium pinniadriaticum]